MVQPRQPIEVPVAEQRDIQRELPERLVGHDVVGTGEAVPTRERCAVGAPTVSLVRR
jgi:hypothetical protein